MENMLSAILERAKELKASDIHLKVKSVPAFRIVGEIVKDENFSPLTDDAVKGIAASIIPEHKKEELKEKGHADFGVEFQDGTRCRVNVFSQRGTLSISMRIIPDVIRSFEELNLPDTVRKLSEETKGLILVTGVTGSGKSTTLAAMIDHINSTRRAHIITIEDPIEYVHKDKLSIVNQREVGVDVESFLEGLRGALRQDPDIILIGEIRDLETLRTSLMAAETGHLVLSTVHTIDAVETVNRLISMFPEHLQDGVRYQLSGVLKGVISQRLVRKKDGTGLVPAVEIMVSTSRIRECIQDKTKTSEMIDAIEKGRETYGMISLDQHLLELVKNDVISFEDALKHCRNEVDFTLRYKGLKTGWER